MRGQSLAIHVRGRPCRCPGQMTAWRARRHPLGIVLMPCHLATSCTSSMQSSARHDLCCCRESRQRRSFVAHGEKRRVAAESRGVDGTGLLGSEAVQVVRAAGFRASTREALTTKRLYTYHSTDDIPVDVDITNTNFLCNGISKTFVSRMHTEGQAVAEAIDGIDDLVHFAPSRSRCAGPDRTARFPGYRCRRCAGRSARRRCRAR